MKFINLAIVLLVGLVAARQRQTGVKNLLSSAASRDVDDISNEKSGEDKGCSIDGNDFGSGICHGNVKQQRPVCDEGPQGTVSVSVSSSESYNCNDSAFTTFNFPTIDDYS